MIYVNSFVLACVTYPLYIYKIQMNYLPAIVKFFILNVLLMSIISSNFLSVIATIQKENKFFCLKKLLRMPE